MSGARPSNRVRAIVAAAVLLGTVAGCAHDPGYRERLAEWRAEQRLDALTTPPGYWARLREPRPESPEAVRERRYCVSDVSADFVVVPLAERLAMAAELRERRETYMHRSCLYSDYVMDAMTGCEARHDPAACCEAGWYSAAGMYGDLWTTASRYLEGCALSLPPGHAGRPRLEGIRPRDEAPFAPAPGACAAYLFVLDHLPGPPPSAWPDAETAARWLAEIEGAAEQPAR